MHMHVRNATVPNQVGAFNCNAEFLQSGTDNRIPNVPFVESRWLKKGRGGGGGSGAEGRAPCACLVRVINTKPAIRASGAEWGSAPLPTRTQGHC